ncbi:vacuolar protein sorting-associated protein 52 homolog [Leucoraja erinacea]|uniref:vacuolar protein sorting-associated protein 52 homolog n=1 Tax=Leucoraja erinaceus TaxID=7782 RepID=UPI002456968E|nr:vacuolar protein sorting-associated protein 52 homolog [Leucoraja erinacea]
MPFSKSLLKNRNTIFTLGNRGNVIASSELEAPIIVPHVAQKNDTRYPFESLFRSQHYGLLDNSCREYLFLCDFFMVTGNSAQDLFNAIKGKTLSIVLKHVDTYVADCYDSIAVFLSIHIILRFKTMMTKRNVPAVDNEVKQNVQCWRQIAPHISLGQLAPQRTLISDEGSRPENVTH